MAATSPGSWVEAKDAEEETDSASGSPAEGPGKARDGAGSGRGEDAAPCARLRCAPGVFLCARRRRGHLSVTSVGVCGRSPNTLGRESVP